MTLDSLDREEEPVHGVLEGGEPNVEVVPAETQPTDVRCHEVLRRRANPMTEGSLPSLPPKLATRSCP